MGQDVHSENATFQGKNGKSRHPCLISDFREEAFSLLPLSRMFALHCL